MRKVLGALLAVVAVVAVAFLAGLMGYMPVLDVADNLGVSHVLGLDAGLVSTDPYSVEEPLVLTGMSFGFLSDNQRAVYAGLYRAAASRQQSFSCKVDDLNDIEPALTALLEDHPELFWLDGSCSYSRPVGSKRTTITFDLNLDLSQIDAVQAQIDAAVQAYRNTIWDGASPYEKTRLAYEYVIQNTDYGYGSRQNQNIQSVFIDGESVCAGYARALQYLLTMEGVPCSFVRGSISGEAEDHAWCLVSLDGVTTFVDPTWGDPTYTGPRGEDVDGTITYDYLCLTTDEMERDRHVATYASLLPPCTSTEFDWYRLSGLYLDGYDFYDVDSRLRWAIEHGYTQVAFKFGSDEAYAAAVADLQDHAFLRGAFHDLALSRGETVSRHQYTTSDALRIVRFFWE